MRCNVEACSLEVGVLSLEVGVLSLEVGVLSLEIGVLSLNVRVAIYPSRPEPGFLKKPGFWATKGLCKQELSRIISRQIQTNIISRKSSCSLKRD